jgi:class 3 adenylate cyclase/tetratricopeptide (TPR) repeat protein
MKCPECQFENPEGAKFCNGCGCKLELVCSECGKGNPLGSRFCNKCGQRLDWVLEEKTLPEVESERKHLTVLFSDLSGYTAMTERLDPEDVKEIMSRIFGEIAGVVTKYDGFIERVIGDEVLVFFGVPKAHEDDPIRAIRTARDIHGLVEAMGNELQERVGLPLTMHTGINTGLVVTGKTDVKRGQDGFAGRAINIASRLTELASPGDILVGPDTYRQAEGYFIFERLEPKRVRGKEDTVNAYRVIAPSSRRTRFDVSVELGLTPFVGRERELELLIDGFERSKEGRGQGFSIVSEAGMGKSRLLYEFRKAIGKEKVTFLEGKCLSYRKSDAYHPIIDILKSTFDIQEGEEYSEIKEKVKRGLKLLGIEETSTFAYFMELLSVKDSAIDKIRVSPEAKRDGIKEALKRIVLKGSEIRPLILAVEDLHWIDKSSEEALKHIIESISRAKVILIFTHRLEFVHPWGERSYHRQVNLDRFTKEQSLAIIAHLLGTEQMDRDLETLILEKTGGIPLFVEEFLRSLNDLKMIKKVDNKYHLAKDIQDTIIPSTVQDLIMTRADLLPEGAKRLLQTGSVIGGEFDCKLIRRVTGLHEEGLQTNLSILTDSELIYERGIYPHSTYIFEHALTREVVYGSILTKRKKKLHDEVGKAIENLYKERIHEHYGILAEHFFESENYEKGAQYSELGAKKALKAGSYKDAIELAKRGIISLERLPKAEATQRKIVDARTALASYHLNLNQHVEAKEAVDPIVAMALELNYQRRLSRIYIVIGTYCLWVEEDYPKGLRKLKEALEIAEKTGDFFSVWFASYYLGTALCWNCEFEKGLEYFRKSLDLSTAAKNAIGISFTKGIMSAFNYIFQGKIDDACQTSEESLQVAKEIGDIHVQGMAYSVYGSSCYTKGLWDEAEENLSKGFAYCERTNHIGFGPLACLWLGHLYVEIDEYEKAEDYYKKGIEMCLNHGKMWPSFVNLGKVSLARLKVLNKDQDILPSGLTKYYENNRMKFLEGWTSRHIGEILFNIGDAYIPDAEDWLRKSIESDRKYGLSWLLANDYAVYAKLLKRKGDLKKVKEHMAKAIEIFQECGADGWVEKYEKELAAF